eukprot:c4527_g1_i2.p1 GENE.c4527_g1_i2~~c4527_g1_i2.p1  ORF type:complete len:183 (+),score=22.16 c4527_g1_i2:34-582(+)
MFLRARVFLVAVLSLFLSEIQAQIILGPQQNPSVAPPSTSQASLPGGDVLRQVFQNEFLTPQTLDHPSPEQILEGYGQLGQQIGSSPTLMSELAVLLEMPEFAEVAALIVEKMKAKASGTGSRPFLGYNYNDAQELRALAIAMPLLMFPYLVRSDQSAFLLCDFPFAVGRIWKAVIRKLRTC